MGALSIGPGLRSLLHGVTPADPSTLLAVPIVLCAMGILAAFLAAIRVLRADPAEILRGDYSIRIRVLWCAAAWDNLGRENTTRTLP